MMARICLSVFTFTIELEDSPPSYEETIRTTSTSRFPYLGPFNPAQTRGNSTQNRYALPLEVVCHPPTSRQDVSAVVSYSAAFRGEIIDIPVGVLSKGGTVSFLDCSKFGIINSMPNTGGKRKVRFFDCMIPAIFVCLFCCFITGFCGIVNAYKARHAARKNDIVRCRKKMKYARNYIIGSIVLGVCITGGLCAFYIGVVAPYIGVKF